MPFLKCNPEITLIFDDLKFRPSRQQFELLQSKLSGVEGIISVEIQTDWLRRQQLTAVFKRDVPPEVMLRKMALELRGLSRATPATETETETDVAIGSSFSEAAPEPSTFCRLSHPRTHCELAIHSAVPASGIITRVRQLFYGTLAVTSLGMAWVGLLVPGIPTVPFVLLTAHFALKTSDSFRERLLTTRTFGPMMRDWQNHRAIRRSVRARAYVLTMILTTVTLILAPVSIVLYSITATMFVIGMVLISRLPVIDAAESAATATDAAPTFPRLAAGTAYRAVVKCSCG